MFKLLETEKVARNTRSCQKVVEQLVESPNGGKTQFYSLTLVERVP